MNTSIGAQNIGQDACIVKHIHKHAHTDTLCIADVPINFQQAYRYMNSMVDNDQRGAHTCTNSIVLILNYAWIRIETGREKEMISQWCVIIALLLKE